MNGKVIERLDALGDKPDATRDIDATRQPAGAQFWLRGGAVPGAVHLEWTQNLRPDGTFKSPDELRAMYVPLGVTPDKEVMTYCQGGYRAAHAYLAFRVLGYTHVRNYTGSWKEWGDRTETPIEQPRRPS